MRLRLRLLPLGDRIEHLAGPGRAGTGPDRAELHVRLDDDDMLVSSRGPPPPPDDECSSIQFGSVHRL